MYLKLSSEKWRPFCLGLNVLTYQVKIGHRVQTEIMNDQYIQISFIYTVESHCKSLRLREAQMCR